MRLYVSCHGYVFMIVCIGEDEDDDDNDGDGMWPEAVHVLKWTTTKTTTNLRDLIPTYQFYLSFYIPISIL